MSSNWRYGKRSKYRAKISQDPDDHYRIDVKKSRAENVYDIYTALCSIDTRETKRLFLLNGLASLCQQNVDQSPLHMDLGFSTEELLYCLSACLTHSFAQVRAAALRTIRYVFQTANDIVIFNSLELPQLLCRSIDVVLKNDDERVQAFKLIRKMLAIAPRKISPLVVRCLVSLADNGIEDSDSMLRACLATLCEFAVLNPSLFIVCGGVTSITRNLMECHNPRIAESLCGVLLYLLEWPQTRNISGVRLDCLAAPYCDFTYRLGIMDKNKDARELRYTSCRLALLSILRSWTGTIEFCDPSKHSGLKAIVDALYLNQIEVRKAILDLLFELLGLSQPTWTKDFSVAFQAIDPADFQDTWLLSNGFVAMEGRSILPSLAARSPNICEQHLALLLYCFLETGLLNALVEVIVSNDTQLSVRATVLIGKILNLMHTHLPADICSTCPALPTLITYASQGNQNATIAISALQNYQSMLRKRPASCSLFLDNIIQGGALMQTRIFRRELSSQSCVQQSGPTYTSGFLNVSYSNTSDRQRLDSVSSSDDSQGSSSRRSSFRLKHKLLPFLENLKVNRLIKDSNVISHPDGISWDWEIIVTILRSNMIKKMDDTSGRFLKRLIHYFKPSSNRFSHQDLVLGPSMPTYVTAGLDLIDWLLSSQEIESIRLLTDFFSDVSLHLLAVRTSNRAHDCLFSPQHMNNTMCQQYFLYIGRMCRTQKGISILTNTTIFEYLSNLVLNSDHMCYVKLIVSGLNYNLDSITRRVLEKALTKGKLRSGRLYATQFLVVLLRARLPNFEVWGIPMIIQQTRDPDRGVMLAAIEVLEEACHEKYYLEEIVSLWPNLKQLGDIGKMVMSRYYSLSRGLNHQRAKIKEEIESWKNIYNKRYVLHVEANAHACLTLHVRNEDGCYSRRNCNTRPSIIPPNIPPHLYGQLVQTTQGITALRKFGDLIQLTETVSRGKCVDEVECLELKSAIWAVSHASTHSNGIEYFIDAGSRIYEKLIILATKCEVNSVRATAFSALGLVSGTKAGATTLAKLNWLSVRHDRNTIWPVYEPEDCISTNYTPIRHHYEAMPPYNYSGIEDQIDGSYYTGSSWNLLVSNSSITKDGVVSDSLDTHESNLTTDGNKFMDESLKQMEQVGHGIKSRTLPDSNYIRHVKHQRSLSESKTTDVISLISGPGIHHQHRTRYNSCTDSNTSGVSSCESVTGRATIGGGSDFQQFPLSPIPSMSNLLEVPPTASLLRRTSLIGIPYYPNVISQIDMKGYAQLRSLRRHCRPVLSESAADIYDFITQNDITPYSSVRAPKSSKFELRHIKVQSLDRFSSFKMPTHTHNEDCHIPLPTFSTPKFLSVNDSNGPCYSGICLPKNLLELFPTRNTTHTYVSFEFRHPNLININSSRPKDPMLDDFFQQEAGDESSVISSLSDVSSIDKRPKWLRFQHDCSNCLNCCRSCRKRTPTDKLQGHSPACEICSINPITVFRKVKHNLADNSSTPLVEDNSSHSPESIISDDSTLDRVYANILYNVQKLANPVRAKHAKTVLLELKQKHSLSFQNICLYSEVSKVIGYNFYRMSARRFLQELFLDLNFDSFQNAPKDILSKKEQLKTMQDAIDMTNMELLIEKNSGKDAGHSTCSSTLSEDILKQQKVPTILRNNSSIGNVSSLNTNSTIILANNNFNSCHKSHIKSQPLASVSEASCENLLLENSPQIKTQNSLLHSGNSNSNSRPIQDTMYRSQNYATHDDSDDLDSIILNYLTNCKTDIIKNNKCMDLRITDDDDSSKISLNVEQYCQLYNPHTTKLSIDNPSNNLLPRSPKSLISQHSWSAPMIHTNLLNTTTPHKPHKQQSSESEDKKELPTNSVVNENKLCSRGRSYTFELDLSCTKNKFPITHRNIDIQSDNVKKKVNDNQTEAANRFRSFEQLRRQYHQDTENFYNSDRSDRLQTSKDNFQLDFTNECSLPEKNLKTLFCETRAMRLRLQSKQLGLDKEGRLTRINLEEIKSSTKPIQRATVSTSMTNSSSDCRR